MRKGNLLRLINRFFRFKVEVVPAGWMNIEEGHSEICVIIDRSFAARASCWMKGSCEVEGFQ